MLEWAGTLVFIAFLVGVIDIVGEGAEHRVSGWNRSGAAASIDSSTTESNGNGAQRFDAPFGPTPPDESEVGAERDIVPPTNEVTPRGCEDGFTSGAANAFVHTGGDAFGDMFGTTDKRLKEVLWDRPAGDALRDLADGTMQVAPSVVAAVPALMERATTGWSTRRATDTGHMLLQVLVVDSLQNAKQLTLDGWNGSRTLTAAFQSGDCVAFGQTLRSGVNNAPEAALTLLDVASLAGGAAKVGRHAVAVGRAATLAKEAATLGKMAAVAKGIGKATDHVIGLRNGVAAASSASADATGAGVRGAVHAAHAARGVGSASAPTTRVGVSSSASSARFATGPRNILERGVAASIVVVAALEGAAGTIVDTIGSSARSVVQTVGDVANGIRHAHATRTALGESLRNGNDWLPWQGALVLGAVRLPEEIHRLWPKLSKLPSLHLLAVWDLAQANRRSIDRLLTHLEQRVFGDDVARELWHNHGQHLFRLRFQKSARPIQSTQVRPVDPPDPAAVFWVGRADWNVLGRHLPNLDPDAYTMLQNAITQSATQIRLPDPIRSGRALAVAEFLSGSTSPVVPSPLAYRNAVEYGEHIQDIVAARRHFDDAERSLSIAHMVNDKGPSFAVRPELVELIARQRVAVHVVNAPGQSRQLPHGSITEIVLKTSLSEQAEAESLLRGADQNFLTELAQRKIAIEVYGHTTGTPDIDVFANYVTWIDDQRRVLYFVELNPLAPDAAGFPPLPFATIALPSERPFATHASVLNGLPSSDAPEEVVFDFHQVLNDWRSSLER